MSFPEIKCLFFYLTYLIQDELFRNTIISNINAKLISKTDSKSFDYTVSTRIFEKWWGIDLSRVDELTIIRFLCEYYHKKGFIVFSNNFHGVCQITICWGNFIYEDKKIKIS